MFTLWLYKKIFMSEEIRVTRSEFRFFLLLLCFGGQYKETRQIKKVSRLYFDDLFNLSDSVACIKDREKDVGTLGPVTMMERLQLVQV